MIFRSQPNDFPFSAERNHPFRPYVSAFRKSDKHRRGAPFACPGNTKKGCPCLTKDNLHIIKRLRTRKELLTVFQSHGSLLLSLPECVSEA